MNRLLLVVLCLSMAACGGSSSSGPSPVPTPPTGVSTLTFVSTLSGAPVSGARVTVAGVAYTTNASGQITLTAPATAGVTIDASASGFIDRATVVRSESIISLWQVPAGVDVSWVRDLVYNHTGNILRRPTASVVYIQLASELAGDSASRSAHVQAAAMATAVTGGRVQVQVNDMPPSGSVVFSVQLNESAIGTGVTFVTASGGRISGGRIEYRRINEARLAPVVAHEMGHALGFGHPPFGLMCLNSIACASDFGQAERDVYTSMWARNPGTLAPDNDRSTTAASLGEQTLTFVCWQ